MSKSISLIFILLIIIIAGFAYFNYNQLNRIQSDLLKKEALLEESERLIEEQGTSLVQMEEKIKEALEKDKILSDEMIMAEKEDKLQKQLEGYQEELLALQLKMAEVLQKNISDTESISLLREEKSKLESSLEERETQWLEKEKDNKEIISSLQEGIRQYETEMELVNKKVLNIEQYLETEQLKRQELEQDIKKYEDTIDYLKEQLALKEDEESYVQQISKLEKDKKELEEEVAEKDSSLIQFYEEYQNLQNQLADYERKINQLTVETAQVLEQKGILAEIKDNLTKLEQEKSKMEKILQEKETQWLEKEQVDKEIIAQLQEEIKKYELNIKEIGKEILVLQEDLIKEKALQEPVQKEIDISSLEKLLADKEIEWAKQNEQNRRLISYLKGQLEDYKKEIDIVKLDSSLFKEEIATQIDIYQQNLTQIGEKESQISLLTSQIELYMQKIDDYEKSVAEFKMRLQEQEDINYQEQQSLIETIHSLVKEREEYQNSINQYYAQVNKFQLEIAQLKNKIGVLESEKEPKYYEVKSGDCLWNIARNKYNEGIAWIKIFRANEELIQNPEYLYPGDTLIIF
ncbi:MAG TPA: LysM peptidoglycan-binding domain-containing protein, partial [Atribacterota bacterium]|nr:LysM peptidoglycan-binding domain-containing protein [Atribacterota bacterium]